MKVQINSERLREQLYALASFSDVPSPAVTRIVFSATDLKARNYIKGLFADAGLQVREDGIGNMYARWEGEEKTLAAVATGSHVDAIPNAGMFDGTVGVLGGLEAIRSLQACGFRPTKSIELVMFTAEEPTRFGIGCLGSRLLSGAMTLESARSLRDHEGRSLDEVRMAAGFTEGLARVPLPAGYYSAFVELHIEQGPLLEKENIPIGVVTQIAAPASIRLTLVGEGGHAGAVLMPERRDAFLAAAEIALAVEQVAKSTGSLNSVATVGVCDVFPGAVNSIPSRVQLELDIRDTSGLRRDKMLEAILSSSNKISKQRNVAMTAEILNADDPATADPAIVSAISGSCEDVNTKYMQMVSRAYHDSLFMARIAPIGMIFIPCRNGVSHRPDEYASDEDIKAGVTVLGHTLARLASQ